MAPTLVVPGVHLGLSGGFAFQAEVRVWLLAPCLLLVCSCPAVFNLLPMLAMCVLGRTGSLS